MTYAQIKRMTLELINQYTIAGEAVSPAYDNQADYLLKIPNLINSALTQIHLALRPARDPKPDRLPPSPSDSYETSAPDEWIQCACYYAAALLVIDDSEFLYAALMNEYESFLSRLTARQGVTAEWTQSRDPYHFGGASWLM